MAKKSAKKPVAKKPQPSKSKVKPKQAAAASKSSATKSTAAKSSARRSPTKAAPVKAAKRPAALAPAKASVAPAAKATPAIKPAPAKPAAQKAALAPMLDARPLKKKKKKLLIDEPPVRLPPPPVTSDSKMQKNRAGLTQKELEHFRDLLLEKRRELLGDVTSMEREALRSGNTNLSTLPVHMADTGTDNYEQEFTLGLVEKDRQLLREINIALAKIQDGSYGLCEGTGKPISKARLEAQPWARYSIEHARALEKPMFRRSY